MLTPEEVKELEEINNTHNVHISDQQIARYKELTAKRVSPPKPVEAPQEIEKRCPACNGTREQCLDNEYCQNGTWPPELKPAPQTEQSELKKKLDWYKSAFEEAAKNADGWMKRAHKAEELWLAAKGLSK